MKNPADSNMFFVLQRVEQLASKYMRSRIKNRILREQVKILENEVDQLRNTLAEQGAQLQEVMDTAGQYLVPSDVQRINNDETISVADVVKRALQTVTNSKNQN